MVEVDVKTFRAGIGPVANIQKIATKKTHAPGYCALHLSRQNLKPRTVLGSVVLKNTYWSWSYVFKADHYGFTSCHHGWR